MTKEEAELILKVRDELVKGDIDQAYHYLYRIADPDCTSFTPWERLEIISGRKEQEFGSEQQQKQKA